MYILIYRKKDGTIRRITNCDSKLKKGWTRKKMDETIQKFNEANPDNWVELRKVSKKDEDFLRILIPDDVEFMTEPILHDAYDYTQSGKYIYEFCKCEKHNYPLVHIMKINTKGESRVAEIHHDNGELPFAWCYASDLLNLLGVSKGAMNRMIRSAESVAWGWYKRDKKEEKK